MKQLIQMNAVAKDNDKFLNTLERQFNILDNSDLVTITQCLPSLFNGLRLVFIISKHYKDSSKMSELLKTIANQICDRVKGAVDLKSILTPKDGVLYDNQLDEAIHKIEQAKNVLDQWVNLYKETKKQLETEGTDRWDYPTTVITDRPQYMKKILENFHMIAELLKKLLGLLGPRLKAVTGNTDEIDKLIIEVKDLSKLFSEYSYDFYDKTTKENWNNRFNTFKNKSKDIQLKATTLIESTYTVLRSSVSGFQFLQQFKNMDILEEISSKLKGRYSNVLIRYRNELRDNITIFTAGEEKCIVTKNKPPIAGSISWARYIYQRVKSPILKFLTKREVFEDENLLEEVISEYVEFAERLNAFQLKKFESWVKKVDEEAPNFLKNNILAVSETTGEYYVNFRNDFRVLINEAKYLDRMVPNVDKKKKSMLPNEVDIYIKAAKANKKILNIALQEKEYYRNVDKLNKMLREYYSTINSLKDVEKFLLKEQLAKLEEKFVPGTQSYNFNSLGINDFIKTCMDEIKRFRDTKNKVEEKTRNIEDIVRTIENANILSGFDFEYSMRYGDKEELSLQAFVDYFDDELKKSIKSLADKYKTIGETMLPQIAMAVFEKNDQKLPQMQRYYYYWERRVYNALVKMIVRALLGLKATYEQKSSGGKGSTRQIIPLFKVSTEVSNQKVVTNPSQIEIRVALDKLEENLIEAAKSFPRWKDGTCICVQEKAEKSEEDGFVHTFVSEIESNNIIKNIIIDIGQIKKTAYGRMKIYNGQWESDREIGEKRKDTFKHSIWNQKDRNYIDKRLEKNQSTLEIELALEKYFELLVHYQNEPDEMDAEFIRIDFRKVKRTFISLVRERFLKVGNILNASANKEVELLQNEILIYQEQIQKDEDSFAKLKQCLEVLSKIRDETMRMEFKILDVVEKFRILQKFQQYGVVYSQDKYQVALDLQRMWNRLLGRVKLKDKSLKTKKKTFSTTTMEAATGLQKDIENMYAEYTNTGPSSINTDLDDGLTKMDEYRVKVQKLDARKLELAKNQKLFGIPISNFPKLIEVDNNIKLLSELYDFYNTFKIKYEEWAKKPWEKIEYKELDEGKKEFTKSIRRLREKFVKHPVFEKIETKIEDFKKCLPLINNLKGQSFFKIEHWSRLLEAIRYPLDGIDFSSITLEQVFAMNLQEHPDEVAEIVLAAKTEHNHRRDLAKVIDYWKSVELRVVDFKKSFTIKVEEEIKENLDQDMNVLQGIEGNKLAGPHLKNEVNSWMRRLSNIQETLDTWIKVQTKWLYLEGIYIGNDDIRMQLQKETSMFEKYDQDFSKINIAASKNKSIYTNCIINENTNAQLKSLESNFDTSQKKLKDYLNSKKNSFPRFYFISDEDLLSILGSSDVASVQVQLIKLFDNCKNLLFEKKLIIGMGSDEAEEYNFTEPFKPEGSVENWMTVLEETMITTLRNKTKEGVYMYAKKDRVTWIEENLGMIVIVGCQIWWTWRVEDVFNKVKKGDKYAMKKESAKQTEDLNTLIKLVRTDLEAKDAKGRLRKKINTLIIIDVHARDIVDRFVRDSILDAREFEWESQLRFYWRQNMNDIVIEQCTGTFGYGYEYQGLNGRLVITPLTDRCVMTLTTALTFNLGGAPAGPAGTGKTETCKDLAKSLAIRCLVTNCGENFDSTAMGNIFSGLCQTGFWGCFDEFNRIKSEVLSVVSTQIGEMQRSLKQKKKTVELLGLDVPIKETVGAFITMNPGYEGRSELPDNLKSLFRPVTMVVPDKYIICENMLMSEGFEGATLLAKKMTVLYKLSEEQLSKQYHYDFGLRALKSVLVMAGALKRGSPLIAEDLVLMRALKDMNMPKFVHEDVSLFRGLLEDLFPGMEISSGSQQGFTDTIKAKIRENNLQIVEKQVSKIVQLYETMETRHATMVVGPTGSGKTTVINGLRDALTIPKVRTVQIYMMNPKAQTLIELYGDMDKQTREYTDGILSNVFKTANTDLPERTGKDKRSKEELRWILFDGDVDAVWIENMNSVMDDSRLLTLSNGARYKLKPYCKLLFEVFDLQYASPATISRSGMVYAPKEELGYDAYFNSWKDRTFRSEEHSKQEKHETEVKEGQEEEPEEEFEDEDAAVVELVESLYQKYIPPLIDYIFEGKTQEEQPEDALAMNLPRTPINLITQFCSMMDATLPEDKKKIENNSMEHMFIFALIWSLGACLKENDRDRFLKMLKGLTTVTLPINHPLYDLKYDTVANRWIIWEDLVDKYKPPEDGNFSKILVPTVDTERYGYLLKILTERGSPVLFVGDPGTAKTVIVQNYLANLSSEQFSILNLNFSSRTNSLEVQKNIESSTAKIRPAIWGPAGNKKLIVFVDELHMPIVDKYGTQQPIALLKFLIDKGLMYERGGDLELRKLINTQFCAALLPPAGGFNAVDPRFLSLFNCINILFPNESNIKRIYKEILKGHLNNPEKPFDEALKEIETPLTDMTYKLYTQITDALPRSPLKFHYIFNMRDLSKIYEGILQSSPDHIKTKDVFVKLWRNECTRVFVDRLISKNDVKIVSEDIIPNLIKEAFGDEVGQKACSNPLLFGHFINAVPSEPELAIDESYIDLESFEKARMKCEDMYNLMEEDKMQKGATQVFFDDAVDHFVRLMRILKLPKRHSMLIGVGGSGKRSIARLAAFTAYSEEFQITLKKDYKEASFREDILKLYTEKLLHNKITFVFTDSHIIEEGFLELVNTMLTVGVINALFDEATKKALMGEVDAECRSLKIVLNEEKWNFVVEKFRNNLNLVLCMSPAGESLRIRCRNFPGLVSSTTIDWFFPWPADALRRVAEVNLACLEFDKEFEAKVVDHFVVVHQSIPTVAEEYERSTRRKVFATPKNYLDFLSCYIDSLEEKKTEYKDIIEGYTTGLETLRQAQLSIEKISKEIAVEKVKVASRKEEVEKLAEEVKAKKKDSQIEKTKGEAAAKVLSVKNVEIAEKEIQAKKIQIEKEPELAAAREEVKKIDPKSITEMGSMPQALEPIELLGNCLIVLKVDKDGPSTLGWDSAKRILNGGLVAKLKDYDPSFPTGKMIGKAKGIVNSLNSFLEEKGKSIDAYSRAAKPLLTWINNCLNLYESFTIITQLRTKVAELTKEKEEGERELEATNKKVAELTELIEILKVKYKDSRAELKKLEEELETMQTNLENGEKLLTGLESEKIRWEEDKIDKSNKIKLLEAECLLNASFLSYFGPFDQEYRAKFDAIFRKDLSDKGLFVPEDFRVEQLLTTDVEVSQWNSQTLPSDTLSVQNGILTLRGKRYPLCIDPQEQAVNWIKNREMELNPREFSECSINDKKNLTKKLEECFKNGYSLLIVNINEELDPLLDPVLLKDYILEGSSLKVLIGDKSIDVFNSDFRLYMTTKLPNPYYSPEIMGKASVINYTVNMDGLKEQLLNEVIAFEKPATEEKRKLLILETSKNKQILKDSEKLLLYKLSNVKGSLLKDTELIKQLTESRIISKEITEKLIEGEETKKQIEEARQSYVEAAKRGAILFFCMKKLSAISEMYEYSLSSYLRVFKRSLEQADPDALLMTRIKHIINTLTKNFYDYLTLGIFKDHRRVFYLQMTLMIQDGEGKLNHKELDFFLKGNTSLDDPDRENPFDWLTDSSWKDLTFLRKFGDTWKELGDSIEINEPEWKLWYDQESPESIPMPDNMSTKFNSFQLLLILRIIRPDRVSLAVDRYVVERFNGNSHFVEVPIMKPKWLLSQSDEKTPIIYILSPGADPSLYIRKIAEDNNVVGKRFLTLSLGQDMEAEAEDMIKKGSERGYWVLLQNCDLLPDWLKDLEKILDDMGRVNQSFKLWLTTRPTKQFPLGILQKSLKIVTEPPAGIKNNMEDVASKVDEKDFMLSKHHGFKPLVYVLTFLHAILLDRTKYGKIGWNVAYDFNFSDFSISFQLLQLYLNKSLRNNEDTMPWESLKYLIGEAMYGGRVTDDYDRRTLMTYLDEYMGDFLFDKNNEFFFAKSHNFSYKLPEFNDKDQMMHLLKELQSFDSPVVFGLNPNAEITYYTNDAKNLWINYLLMEAAGGSSLSTTEMHSYIRNIADDILEKSKFDEDVEKLKTIAFERNNNSLTPSEVVLFQELEIFKKLTIKIQKSLEDLKRALSGKIGMSAELDELSISLYNGFLPNQWRKLAPMTQKKLGSWMNHFTRRKAQYRGWLKREPSVIWLSGLHNPESYLTALVQDACRIKKWALDKSTLFTIVTDIEDPSTITEKPQFGCYITGLFLEGVSWDSEKASIRAQRLKELIYEMPIVQIVPVEFNKLKLKDSLKVPVYVTQNRRNAAGVGHVFDADLHTEEHPSHWVLQGVCMVLNTDQ